MKNWMSLVPGCFHDWDWTAACSFLLQNQAFLHSPFSPFRGRSFCLGSHQLFLFRSIRPYSAFPLRPGLSLCLLLLFALFCFWKGSHQFWWESLTRVICTSLSLSCYWSAWLVLCCCRWLGRSCDWSGWMHVIFSWRLTLTFCDFLLAWTICHRWLDEIWPCENVRIKRWNASSLKSRYDVWDSKSSRESFSHDSSHIVDAEALTGMVVHPLIAGFVVEGFERPKDSAI